MHTHYAHRNLGQNFLIDKKIIEIIVKNIKPRKKDNFIELGSGYFSLTKEILNYVDKITIIEIDDKLNEFLIKKNLKKKISLVEDDIKKINFKNFGSNFKIFGNLPFNISKKVIFYLLNFKLEIVDQNFMIQKDVSNCIMAYPGTRNFSYFSVIVQSNYSIKVIIDKIFPKSFFPKPKVNSALIKMVPINTDKIFRNDNLINVTKKIFFNKRKNLLNILNIFYYCINLKILNIYFFSRPEDINVNNYIYITNMICDVGLLKNLSLI